MRFKQMRLVVTKHTGLFARLVAVVLVAVAVNKLLIANFVVLGPSMYPNYIHGDRVIIETVSPSLGEFSRGTLIVFRDPEDSNGTCFKRIVAIPGDVVEVIDNQVFINGFEVEDSQTKGPDRVEPVLVPAGGYFVLGDNREFSRDSRSWPQQFINRDQIVGSYLARYWSADRQQAPPPELN